MRSLLWLLPLASLVGCESSKVEETTSEPHVLFSQPFPQFATDEARFPARLRGTYLAVDDTTLQLCIDAHAVWAQHIAREVVSQQKLAEEEPDMRVFDSWQTVKGVRYYLHRRADDSVAVSSILPDTLFHLPPGGAWHLRRFQGSGYLSHTNDPHWRLRRLVLTGNTLRLEKIAFDTLRLAILPPGLLQRPNDSLGIDWVIGPATRKQVKLITQSAGLWETLGEYRRR